MKNPDTLMTPSLFANESAPRLQVELACTDRQIEETLALRYRVFIQELGAKVDCATPQLESDAFDAFCHHLLVRDLSTGQVVASTRILTDTQAQLAGGFYSAHEFDLAFLHEVSGRVMEIGRTCVDAAYRNGATISTLWSGLAQFMENNRFAYLMGCASIPMTDGGVQANLIMNELRDHYLTEPAYRVQSFRALPVRSDGASTTEIKMPPLLKAYLRLGAKVGGEAFWDQDFNTADVFIWLDRAHLQARYLRHFVQRKPPAARFDGMPPVAA
ncbi:GNAT family N-acetyltransferase [Halothiobacillus sp. DCM-1]|uniref:GNAT family N-acetyltransferase n=1 Tax=Halothiobacillus sp. DCM-1 TaxID=3112558 RepID=UPI0032470E57